MVEVAGVVTHRQQPATAKGTVFLNLEDETGLINVICPKGVWKRFRKVARVAPALRVRGVLERHQGVINVVAQRIEALPLSLADALPLPRLPLTETTGPISRGVLRRSCTYPQRVPSHPSEDAPMSFGSVMRNKKTWFIGIPVLLVLIFVGGPFVYINFIKDDAPPKLELSTVSTTKPNSNTSSTTPTAASIDGDWTVKSGSTVGYRATEVLFGQTHRGRRSHDRRHRRHDDHRHDRRRPRASPRTSRR